MIRAVLFDVDGTLYHQAPLRILMAAELASAPWVGRAPWKVPRLWRMFAAFRHVREELRALGRPDEPLARLQYTRAAERAHVPVADMEAAVDEWIYKRPLKYLPRVVRSGMADVLCRPGCARSAVGCLLGLSGGRQTRRDGIATLDSPGTGCHGRGDQRVQATPARVGGRV